MEEEARQRSEEETKRKADEAERQWQNKERPQGAADGAKATDTLVDSHGLLGTWHCSGISIQSSTGQSGRVRYSETININKFDGKYYWADGSSLDKPIGGGTARNGTFKQKYWFEGDKLYIFRYERSSALAQQLSPKTPGAVTLKDNKTFHEGVHRFTYKGTKITIRWSGSCSKKDP